VGLLLLLLALEVVVAAVVTAEAIVAATATVVVSVHVGPGILVVGVSAADVNVLVHGAHAGNGGHAEHLQLGRVVDELLNHDTLEVALTSGHALHGGGASDERFGGGGDSRARRELLLLLGNELLLLLLRLRVRLLLLPAGRLRASLLLLWPGVFGGLGLTELLRGSRAGLDSRTGLLTNGLRAGLLTDGLGARCRRGSRLTNNLVCVASKVASISASVEATESVSGTVGVGLVHAPAV